MAHNAKYGATAALVEQYPDGRIRVARKGHYCDAQRDPACTGYVQYAEPYFDANPCRKRDRHTGQYEKPVRICRHCAGIEAVNLELNLQPPAQSAKDSTKGN